MPSSFILLRALLALAACGDTALEQGLIGGGAVGNIAYCQTYSDRCN